MTDLKKLEGLAFRLVDLPSLRKLVVEGLQFEFADKPVSKQNWTDDEKEIVVESKIGEKKKFVSISVLDRGPGITEKDKKNIFKENFSKSGGTGIGLYKAKLLTIDQGGYINVEDRVGGGATIIFSFRL